MIIKINPLDTLFFRDGKPFGIGEETWTGSTVLPNPSVIWGALFSMLLGHNKVNRKEIDKEIHRLKLGKVFLYNEEQNTLLLPAPLDLFEHKDGSKQIEYARFEKYESNSTSNFPMSFLAYPDISHVATKTLSEKFIDINTLVNSYRKKNPISLTAIEDIAISDYKIGIGRNNTSNTAQEGSLYRIALTQFEQGWSFLIEVEFDGEMPDNGLLRIGGEGKTASFEVVKEELYLLKTFREENAQSDVSNYFKIVLTSPTFFDSGWGQVELSNSDFDITAAFVGKPISIGGFDVKLQEPKRMRKAVPIGSVFYLHNKNHLSFKDLEDKLKGILKEDKDKGFGTFEILPLK